MANEITLASLVSASLVDYIRERALWYATHNFLMSRLVTGFSDATGFASRTSSVYGEGAAPAVVTELEDLTPSAFERALLATLTPKEIARQNVITDRRLETDNENILQDTISDIGYQVGKYVEKDLLSLFASLTGGIYGGDGTAMSLDLLYSARARLERAGIPGPYVCVLDSYQWLDLHKELTNLDKPAPLSLRERAQQQYFVSQVADFFIYVSTMFDRVAVQNEIQTVTVTGTPTGGNFKLAFGAQPTAVIAFDAAAAAVKAALEALPNIAAGDITCTGSAGGPYTVTFGGTLAGEDVPKLTLYNNGLTGGSDPSVTIAVSQEGKNYAQGAMFSRDAMAIDLRRPMRIEPQRDASLRLTEYNTTMVYASGMWRPERGVILRSDASTPLG